MRGLSQVCRSERRTQRRSSERALRRFECGRALSAAFSDGVRCGLVSRVLLCFSLIVPLS